MIGVLAHRAAELSCAFVGALAGPVGQAAVQQTADTAHTHTSERDKRSSNLSVVLFSHTSQGAASTCADAVKDL